MQEKRLIVIPTRWTDTEVEMIDLITQVIFHDYGKFLNRSEIIRAGTLRFVARRLVDMKEVLDQLHDEHPELFEVPRPH